jgi:ketosteroid isomerase-like protein
LFAEIPEAWGSLRIEVEELREAGERVVSINTVIGKGRSSGVEVRWPSAHMWTLRDGLVAGLRMYRDPADALEAAGLSE